MYDAAGADRFKGRPIIKYIERPLIFISSLSNPMRRGYFFTGRTASPV